MKSARLPELTTLTLIEHERNYRHHMAKLLSISKSNTSIKQKISEHDIRVNRNQEALRRKHDRRLLEIHKDNERLLTKLLKISVSKEKKTSKSQPKVLTPNMEGERLTLTPTPPPENSTIRTNNTTIRKKEFVRLVNENTKITERIPCQASNLSKEKLERQYQQTREYMNRLRKIRINTDSNTIEFGHGGAKLSRDMRLTTHKPYLPPLNSIATGRSVSVSRVQTENPIMTNKSTEKTPQSVSSARGRKYKDITTETHNQETPSYSMARCQSSPNFKRADIVNYPSGGTLTNSNVVQKQSPQQSYKSDRENIGSKSGSRALKSATKERRLGDSIHDSAKRDQRSDDGLVVEESKTFQPALLIKEESLTKEDSTRYLENFETLGKSEDPEKANGLQDRLEDSEAELEQECEENNRA